MWRPISMLSVTTRALHGSTRRQGRHLALVPANGQLPRSHAGWSWPSMGQRLTPRTVLVSLMVLILAILVIIWEVKTSGVEAFLAPRLTKALTYETAPGPSDAFPALGQGPYDLALGYGRLPEFTARLAKWGYHIAEQARLSPIHRTLNQMGLFPIYQEKAVHGLAIQGASRQLLSSVEYPTLRYRSHGEIPPLVSLALLYIEDRRLIEERDTPTLNPAVSWERFAKAGFELLLDKIGNDRNVPGGSTLATQIEKFRHSPDGRTRAPSDKLRQMASATARAYLLGQDTREARDQIILTYINEVPLGAVPGLGEIRGLGEGLRAWFGADLTHVTKALMVGDEELHAPQKAKAQAFKKVLALFLSQRRPAYYLQGNQKDLLRLTNSYIRRMRNEGVIAPSMAELALQAPLPFLPPKLQRSARFEGGFVAKKAANAVRVELKNLLGVKTMYELDRLDLQVKSTFDVSLQQAVSMHLSQLKQREEALKAGIFGEKMLALGQEESVDFSFTLIERKDDFNAVRVQTDTHESPLDLNRGGKLELGSTAKLRTLVTYLEMIAEIDESVSARLAKGEEALAIKKSLPEGDSLSRFVAEWREKADGDHSLDVLLSAALKRSFSASPWQRFWTGGGQMTFNNFDPEENGLQLSVLEAFQRSNNLVFVRVMQEMVNHIILSRIPEGAAILNQVDHPLRKTYLEQFIEMEGAAFVRKFYRDLRPLTADERLSLLIGRQRVTSSRVGALILSLRPDLDFLGFRLMVKEALPSLEESVISRYWQTMRPGIMSLTDRAYVAKVHPIALWMVRYLDQNPRATLPDVLFDSRSIRHLSYRWLRDHAGPKRQERDIRTMLEREAFHRHIVRLWHKQGFPFKRMVPSLASALGSSGDRPAALADLMGAINNNGVILPTRRIEELRFGPATPFETALVPAFAGAKRALRPEVARAAREATLAVVQGGTARRLKDTIRRSDGSVIEVGAKTGTGDNRLERYGSYGQVIKSEAKSRTATLVFSIGERFFGVITAYVNQDSVDVDAFKFTSSLVVQVTKSLIPVLEKAVQKVEDPWAIALNPSEAF